MFVIYNMYGQELGLYKAQTKLPFNAFGTMAMARDVRNFFCFSPTLLSFMCASNFVL